MAAPFILKLEHGAELSNEDRKALGEAIGGARQFRPREDLIREGDRPDNVHVILEGFCCRYKVVPDGGRQIVAYLIPGDFCDWNVPILGEMDHNIGALTTCKVAALPHRAVEALTAKHPTIARALWWATLVDEGILREWLVGIGRRPADKRLAHLFCELLLRLQIVGHATHDSFELRITQAQLADTLGITEVHVNRTFQQLRADGLITRKGHAVTINDVDRLKAFADFNPNYLHLKKRIADGSQGSGGDASQLAPDR
jgi:CRP-like cAMP-binding protein